jgi:hypothetical protein
MAERSSIPEDFPQFAQTMTIPQLVEKYGVNPRTVSRWRKKLGLNIEVRKFDFPEDIEELARKMSIKGLARHFGQAGNGSFGERLMREHPRAYALAKRNGNAWRGREMVETNKQRVDIPEDFRTLGRTMTISGAAERWQTDTRRVRMWAEVIGDGFLEAMLENGRHASRMAGATGRRSMLQRRMNYQSGLPLHELAMTHIRRKTRFTCYSDRIYGGNGDVYFIGNRKVDFDGLIAVAKQYGFSVG